MTRTATSALSEDGRASINDCSHDSVCCVATVKVYTVSNNEIVK